MWGSAVDGRVLTFHLAGINNQNFVMQDAETGTWWQQVTGEAILGPLKGRHLRLLAFDHVTFAAWRREAPGGRVLAPDPVVLREGRYAPVDWETAMGRMPTLAHASRDRRLEPRAIVVGVAIGQAARAYPVERLTASQAVVDQVGATPVLLVRGADGRSTRVFERTVEGRVLEFVVKAGASDLRLVDLETGSEWDFRGEAVAGPLEGRRLVRVPFLEEYWFDWQTFHPATDVFAGR